MTMNVSYRYTRGLSYARGTSIDPLISQEDRERLYERWSKEWPEPLQFHGNETDITCELVIETVSDVGESTFLKVMGKAAGTRILEVARTHGG